MFCTFNVSMQISSLSGFSFSQKSLLSSTNCTGGSPDASDASGEEGLGASGLGASGLGASGGSSASCGGEGFRNPSERCSWKGHSPDCNIAGREQGDGMAWAKCRLRCVTHTMAVHVLLGRESEAANPRRSRGRFPACVNADILSLALSFAARCSRGMVL